MNCKPMTSGHLSTAVTAALGVALLAAAPRANAQACAVEAEDFYGLSGEQIVSLYACMEAEMAAAYAQSDNEVAKSYREWTVAGVRPGPDPSHGDRLLLTFANELAADAYLQFGSEGVEMPVGAVLAKESIGLGNGTAQVGPLFIMEKVGAEAAPDTGGWRYSGVQPNGAMLGAPESFCHDCHSQFEGQDALAYPAEELRVSD